jgi:hypothetical protein
LDPVTGTAGERPLDDRSVEFATIDDNKVGRASHYVYTVADTCAVDGTGAAGAPGVAIVKSDTAGGTTTSHELDPDTAVGEAIFVPATGTRREDDGWLISIATRRNGPPQNCWYSTPPTSPPGPSPRSTCRAVARPAFMAPGSRTSTSLLLAQWVSRAGNSLPD